MSVILITLFFCALPTFASVSDLNLAQCLDKIAKKNLWQSPQEFKEIVCHNKGIVSLDGLENYFNIKKLSLHKNKIEFFDGTSFKELETLNLGRNRLTSLALNKLAHLRDFYVFDNRLKSLSLTHLPSLERFKANSNRIDTFFYKDLPKLRKVYMFDNNMKHIDIYSLPKMKYMDVRQNPMPDLLYEEMDKIKGATIFHDGNADDWN